MNDVEIPKELIKKFSNKWWRLNNLYWIINQFGKKVPFRCNWAQEQFYDNLWYCNILLKARQWGGTTFTDIYFLDDCLFLPNIEAGIIAHNLVDAQKIFRRKVKFPYDNLPQWLKDQRRLATDSRSELAFGNGSIIYVSTSVRSGTVQRLHISEYGKICRKYPEKAEEIRTGSLNAVHEGMMIVIESTAEGQFGDFYDRCTTSMKIEAEKRPLSKLEYKFHFVPWFVNPDYQTDPLNVTIPTEMVKYFDGIESITGVSLSLRQRAWYTLKASEMGDKMKQEYPSTPEEAFERLLEGAFYSEEMMNIRKNGQLLDIPYDPALPVNTGWEIGMDDDFCILFHQRYGFQNRLIDFYKNRGLGLGHYVRILREKGYVYGKHYLPHDAKVRELGDEERAVSRLERLKKLAPSETWVLVPKIDREADGTEAVRVFLPSCWFDKEKCDHLIKALDSYRREWDDKLGVFKPTALHDWASHPETTIRTLACGYKIASGGVYRPKRTGRVRRV